MELDAICMQYNVSEDVLNEFINAGIIEITWQDIDENIENIVHKRMETSTCLFSLGIDVETIKQYVLLQESDVDTRKERIKILQCYRDKNLKNIHKTKKTLDCIDCILHDLD